MRADVGVLFVEDDAAEERWLKADESDERRCFLGMALGIGKGSECVSFTELRSAGGSVGAGGVSGNTSATATIGLASLCSTDSIMGASSTSAPRRGIMVSMDSLMITVVVSSSPICEYSR